MRGFSRRKWFLAARAGSGRLGPAGPGPDGSGVSARKEREHLAAEVFQVVQVAEIEQLEVDALGSQLHQTVHLLGDDGCVAHEVAVGGDVGDVTTEGRRVSSHIGGLSEAGSRSIRSHAAETVANLSATVGSSTNPMLYSVAKRAAIAGVRRGPPPPTITGRGDWTGFGSAGASSRR